MTPLLLAAGKGQVSVVKMLLDYKADIGATNEVC
jgi:ankyrin repeat protein